MPSDVGDIRPVYIWGPQLEFISSMTSCGPCELYELTSLAEAFAFAPQLAASSVSAELWPKMTTGSASDITATDIQRVAAERANLGSSSAATQWEAMCRMTDATPLGRVAGIRKALDRGDRFFHEASSDMAAFFGTFFEEGFDVLPSPEFSLPVLSGLRRYTVARTLLRNLESQIAVQLKPLQSMMQSRLVPIPPLTALLLDRCKTADDIPSELSALRTRFSSARAELLKYELRLASANTLGDQFDAIRDIERAQLRIAEVVAREDRWGITKSLVRHAWDIAKQGSLFKAATSLVDLSLDPLLNRPSRRLATHFVDIQRQLREVNGYFGLLERVFGEKEVEHAAFQQFEPIQLRLENLHSTKE